MVWFDEWYHINIIPLIISKSHWINPTIRIPLDRSDRCQVTSCGPGAPSPRRRKVMRELGELILQGLISR